MSATIEYCKNRLRSIGNYPTMKQIDINGEVRGMSTPPRRLSFPAQLYIVPSEEAPQLEKFWSR